MNKFILKKYFLISVLSTLLLFLSFNFIINKINFNIGVDFTSTKTFTLSKGTKNVLANIQEPLQIEFIYSRELSKNIPIIQNYANQIEGLLSRYVDLAKGKINLEILDPEPYSDQEDYVERFGVQGFPVDQEGSNIYFGLIATNTTDDIEIISFFDPSKAGSLEKQLTDIVYKLNRIEKPTIGILTQVETQSPNPNIPLQGEYIIFEQLENYYEIQYLSPTAEKIEDIDLLLVYHPSEISMTTEYAIEQFILRGGKTLLFIDPYFEKDDYSEKSSNLANVLKTLNLNYIDQVILDGAQATRLQTQQNISDNTSLQTLLKLNWPEVRSDFINQQEEISNGLSLVRLISPGGLMQQEQESPTTYTSILSSSELTMDLTIQEVQDPINLINNFNPSGIIYDFAVKVGGNAVSNFENFENKYSNHLSQSSENLNVIVFSDADFIRSPYWARVQRFLNSTVIEESSDNGTLVSNIMDVLTGFDDFVDLRNKETPFRPFTVVQKLQAEAEKQYLGQEQELQQKLELALQEIKNLSGGRDNENVQLSDSQMEELALFQLEVEKTRKELREVRRNLNKEIDALANNINVINTFLIPFLLIILMFFLPYQLGIRKRKSR
ncbi:GldG family protein [Alphaproteobacteria bacterium]|nr:GldG family protein [Alphaproteobacteria bacterium]